MIDQLTVFIENKTGRLTALCKTLGDAGINMNALSVADTADYGVARIICSDPARAAAGAQATTSENATTALSRHDHRRFTGSSPQMTGSNTDCSL